MRSVIQILLASLVLAGFALGCGQSPSPPPAKTDAAPAADKDKGSTKRTDRPKFN